MANFQRVIRPGLYFLIGVLLSAVTTFSYASDYPAVLRYTSTTCPSSGSFNTAVEACSSVTTCGYHLDRTVSFIESIQQCHYFSASPYYDNNWGAVSLSYTCPAGGTLSGTTCTKTCAASEILNADGTCTSVCPSGTTIGTSASKYGGDGSAVGGVICIAGCQVQADTCGYGGGHYGCVGPFTTLGQSCPTTGASNAAEVPSTDPRTDCIEKGQSYGTVNGAVVCVAATGSSTTKTETTSSGGTSGTGSTTTKNTSTDCTGGSCSSSTTTTTTSGGSGAGGTGAGSTTTSGTTTEKTDKATFCSENPDLSICKTSTFSGTCAAGAAPACDGDPVQCAQANAAFKLECEISTEPTDDAYKLGKSIAGGGADPKGNPLDPANIPQVDVGSIVSAAAGNRTLSATCIPSPTFSVQGHTYTMDTTLFCQFAQVIGYLMVAASTVIAIRMVA